MADFRREYLTYDELTARVKAWAAEHPAIVRLESACTSAEGREVWLLTIGRDPERARPAAWVDGNMHASELAGSSVALAIAEELIRVHAGGPAADLPEHVAELLREGLCYVMPRMSPDGAERMRGVGAYVRSNPRDRRGRTAPYWCSADLDGDGAAKLMRREDPAGDFVASREIDGLMLPRRIEDPPPYYAIYPEGTIANWDGVTVPRPELHGDNDTDLNRNFPHGWLPEPRQEGAGAFALSEPESRAVTELASARPHVFAWLNLHTFGGCFIRPSGDASDKQMDQRDLAVFRHVASFAEPITGYPVVSGFEEFTYEPDKPLAGDLKQFAYRQRGAVALVCELWDFWAQAGLPLLRPFVHNYQRRTRDEIVAIGRWDRDHNAGRAIGAWRPFDHPQLGKVEIGGYDPRVGIWNPPPDKLGPICDAMARMFLRLGALAPRVRVALEPRPLGGGLVELVATVENIGFLPTYVLSSAKALPWNEPPRARLACDGPAIVSGEAVQAVGHLGGWGGNEAMATPYFARTQGDPRRARASWLVRGGGRATVTVSAPRIGAIDATIAL